jgi:hypothetical protein
LAQRNSKKAGKAEKMNARKLVSFYEASERLGVSYWTLWRGAEAGFFKTLYVGSRRMIPELELARIEEYGFGGRKRRPRQENADIAVESR